MGVFIASLLYSGRIERVVTFRAVELLEFFHISSTSWSSSPS